VPKGTKLEEIPSKGAQLAFSADILSETYTNNNKNSNSNNLNPLGFRYGNLLINCALLLSSIINNYDQIYLW
jgi:hypothetical protein